MTITQRSIVLICGMALAANTSFPPWMVETHRQVQRSLIWYPPTASVNDIFEKAQSRALSEKGWNTSIKELESLMRTYHGSPEQNEADLKNRQQWKEQILTHLGLSGSVMSGLEPTEENLELIRATIEEWQESNRSARPRIAVDQLLVESVAIAILGVSLLVFVAPRK